MADPAVRIALLARSGTARDQLHRALSEAGADIVVEGDPAELDPTAVAALSPTVFLVSLEPATEKSIDRFDDLLAAPGVEVMFDDAEVTSKLEGWDLNRWARHLATKLLGADGLPPVPGDSLELPESDFIMQPGAPPTPAELMNDAKLEDYTNDAPELADWVPVSQSLVGSDTLALSDTSAESHLESPGDSDDGAFSLDTDLGLDFDLGELDFNDSSLTSAAASSDSSEGTELNGLDLGESISYSSFGQEHVDTELGDLDADVANLAAQLEAFEKVDRGFETAGAEVAVAVETAPAQSRPVAVARGKPSETSTSAAPAAPANFDFSNLALSPMDGAVSAATLVAEPVAVKFTATAGGSSLELTSMEDSDGYVGLGAVLILAGLGGPDAVRQLLSSLPEKLKMPVLLYQHLEVGKHERLVEQLAKISRLPVVLGRDGTRPAAGTVTLLPSGLTATPRDGSLLFHPGNLTDLISSLPPPESMVIVLSGADVQLVEAILAVKAGGGIVLAQDPEVCFDSAAAEAMRQQGASVYPALGLAKQIAQRWPNV